MTKLRCKCGHPELKGIVHRENGGCYSEPAPKVIVPEVDPEPLIKHDHYVVPGFDK